MIPSLRTIIGWLAVIGVVLFIAKNPGAAAQAGHSLGAGAANVVGGLAAFASGLIG